MAALHAEDAEPLDGEVMPSTELTWEEMAAEARRLYVSLRLHEHRREEAAALIQRHLPNLNGRQLTSLMVEWEKSHIAITEQADGKWGLSQLVRMYERGEVRSAQFDAAASKMFIPAAKIRALEAARAEDQYQIMLVKAIMTQKALLGEDTDEADQVVQVTERLKEMEHLTHILLPDEATQKRLEVMKRSVMEP